MNSNEIWKMGQRIIKFINHTRLDRSDKVVINRFVREQAGDLMNDFLMREKENAEMSSLASVKPEAGGEVPTRVEDLAPEASGIETRDKRTPKPKKEGKWMNEESKEHSFFDCKIKECEKCSLGLEHATKSMSRIFWNGVERELSKKDFEDGNTVTREQMILRGLYILHLEVEGLKKREKPDKKEGEL